MPHLLTLHHGQLLAIVSPGEPIGHASLSGLSTALTDPARELPAFTLPLTWPNLVQLSATMPGAIMGPELQEWAVAETARRTAQVAPGLDGLLPDDFTPYPWQVSAAARFAQVGQALLSDQPGCGKTYSALLGILTREVSHGDALPALVIAPASVVSSWHASAEHLFPAAECVAYRGPRRVPRGDVLVTSYDLAARDADKLAKYGIRTLVVDEHHLIKNPQAARTKAVVKLGGQVDHVIAMSGTPITHSPADIFPTLKTLDVQSWPSSERFADRYLDQRLGDYGVEIAGFRPETRAEFDTCLAGVWRMVTKADALPFLPPKVYTSREVTMPPKWRKAYQDMAETFSADLPDDGGEVDTMHVLTQLAVLMAMTAGPCEVTYTPDEDPEKPDHLHTKLLPGSWKVDELVEVLRERAPGEQVLVFSLSRQLVDLATERLRTEGYQCVTIVGGMSAAAKDYARDAFQTGRARVCLATTQAGGVGLTLTAASCVVFLSRPFSIVDALQAEDRAHRIGSERHKTIDVVDIVTTDSVDQRVAEILRERGMSLQDFLTGAESVRALLKGGKR